MNWTWLIVCLFALSGCRLFGAPDEVPPVEDAGPDVVENNQKNNSNNIEPDMSDMTTIEQPTLPLPTPEDGRLKEGRIFEFRFLEGMGMETSNLEGDIVMDLSATATWIPGRNGIAVDGNGMMKSRVAPSVFLDHTIRTEQFSMEMWAKPSTRSQGGPARLLAISGDTSNADFVIGQDWGDEWVVRLRTTSSTANYGAPEVVAEDVVQIDTPVHIVFTYDGLRARLYIDGNLEADEQRFGALTNWDPTYSMAFGNDQTPTRDWAGEIYLVAAYDRVLTTEEVRSHFVIGSDF